MDGVELVQYLHKVIEHFGGEDYITSEPIEQLGGPLYIPFDVLKSGMHGVYHFRPRYCSEICIKF